MKLSQRRRYLTELLDGFRHPSLESVVRNLVKDHFSTNVSLIENRYSKSRRFVRTIVERKYASILFIFLLYICAASGAWVIYPLAWGPQVPSGTTDFYRDIQSINFALLSAQATLVGLVFPIVIALVGLLTDGRVTHQGRLQLFLSESESTLVGVSGFALLSSVALQSVFFSQIPDRVGAAFTFINVLWFLFNAACISFFLFQTLRYVQPSQRFEIQKKYSANVVWKYQLADIIRMNRWSNAVSYGYWPDPQTFVPVDGSQPFISTLRMHEVADHTYEAAAPNQTRLKDVKLGYVDFVLKQWLRRFSQQSDSSRFCWVEIWPRPKAPVQSPQVLLQITSGPALTNFESFLIKKAFSFEKVGKSSLVDDVFYFVDELISDLMILAESDRTREFEALLKSLTDYHTYLFEIGESTDANGAFNYAQLEDSLGRSPSSKWVRGYQKLMARVSSRLPFDNDMFKALAWSFPRIVATSKAPRFNPIGYSALMLSSNLAHELISWASSQHRSATGDAPGPGARFQLESSFDLPYSDAWRTFIATWEHYVARWKTELRDDVDWDELRLHWQKFREHLSQSVEFVGLAASHGDATAVDWTTDLLVKWMSHARLDISGQTYMRDIDTVRYTTTDFENSWTSIRDQAVSRYPNATGTRVRDFVSAKAVWNGIFSNYFDDCRVSLMLVLTNWTRGIEEDGAALQACTRILKGIVHDRGWHGASENVEFTFDQLLTSILRINSSGHFTDESSYHSSLSQLTASLARANKRSYVSSRIYSGSRSDDVSSYWIEEVVLLAAKAPPPVSPGERRRRHSISNFIIAHSDDEQRRSIQRHLMRLNSNIDEGLSETDLSIIAKLRGAQTTDYASELLSSLKFIVEQSLEELEQVRTNELSEAIIDPNRLREVAEAASREGFNRDTAGFPLSLFSMVERTEDDFERFTLSSQEQNKGEFTAPLMSDPVLNEEEFWARAIKQRVAVVVLSDILQQTEFQSLRTPSPEAFWEAVKRAEAALREQELTPLLVVPGQSDPSWLADWQWNTSEDIWKPQDLRIWRKEEMPEGYLFHLNDIEVYGGMVPSGKCFMLATEHFDRARFTDFNGLPVQVEFEDNENDPWKGTLKLAFERQVICTDEIAFSFEYTEAEAESCEFPD